MTQISFAFSCLSRFTTKSMLNFGREVSGTENITAVMITSFLQKSATSKLSKMQNSSELN